VYQLVAEAFVQADILEPPLALGGRKIAVGAIEAKVGASSLYCALWLIKEAGGIQFEAIPGKFVLTKRGRANKLRSAFQTLPPYFVVPPLQPRKGGWLSSNNP
jgi:hypothetical protein